MELNHRRLGEGEPLLLLHGIGMRWQWWTPVLDALAARFDVWALDHPGHGGTPAFPAHVEPTPAAHADAVEAFAAEHGLERPLVAGISMGGWIALELAKRGTVRAAAAISPAGFWEGWERRYGDLSLRATYAITRLLSPVADSVAGPKAARLALMGSSVAHPTRLPPSEVAGAVRCFAACDFLRTLEALMPGRFSGGEAVEIPVTIAWGKRDRLLLPRQAHRAEAEVRGARLVWLPSCGHIPTYDAPDLVARVIAEAAARG